MHILDRCTTSGLGLGNRYGLNVDVRCSLIKVNVKTNDGLSPP